jgi:hypothetical protein
MKYSVKKKDIKKYFLNITNSGLKSELYSPPPRKKKKKKKKKKSHYRVITLDS